MSERTCSCGSGEPREAIYDGHNIFLCYVCDKCRKERLSHFRPDIMEQYECDEPIEPED